MSNQLIEHIKSQSDKNQIWVECQGEWATDKEALDGKIKYFPKSQGFPINYYPYLKQENFKNPLVAVQFKNIERRWLIHIKCKAFANTGEIQLENARFELYVADNKWNNHVLKN